MKKQTWTWNDKERKSREFLFLFFYRTQRIKISEVVLKFCKWYNDTYNSS